MSRIRYSWDRAARDGHGDWVVAPPRRCRPGVLILSDTLDGVVNPVDGRRYDSKSAYVRAVREAGCEIVGNDPAFGTHTARGYEPRDVGCDVQQAIEALNR